MPDQQQRGPTTSQRDLVSQLLDVIQQQRLRQQQQQLSHSPSSKVSASLPSLTSSDWPTQSLLRSAIDTQAYTLSLPTSITVPAAASTPSSWFPIVTVEPPTTVSLSVQSVGVVQQQHEQDGVGHCPTEQQQNARLSPVQQAFLNFIYTVAASSQQQSTTTAPAATTPTQASMALSQLFLQSQHQTHIPAPPPLSTSTTNPRETTLQNILVSAATLAPHLQRATLASLAAHVTQAYHDTYGGGTASAAAPIRQEPMPSAEAVPVATVHPVSHMPSAPQGPNITKVTLSDVAPNYGFSLGQSQYLPEASTSYGSHMFSGGMVQSVLLSTSTASPIASSSYKMLQPQRHRRVFGISYSAPPEFAEEGTQLALKYQQQITTAKKRMSSDMEQQQDGEAEEEVGVQDGDANEDGSASAYTADTQLTHVREFAHKFKMRRLALGLTQTQVGRALTKAAGPSYSQSAICRFEKLDITKRSAHKIMPVLQGWLQNEERKLTKQSPPPATMVKSVPSWSRTSSSLTGTSFAASSNEVEGPSSSQQTLKRSISESKSESFGTGKQSYLTVGNASEEDCVDSPVLLDGDVADGGPSAGHSHNRGGKKRKRRTSFNPQALDVLNEFFAHNEHPSSREVSELADRLEYEREIIRVWFCNKRQAKKNAVRRLRGGLIGGGHRSSTMSFP